MLTLKSLLSHVPPQAVSLGQESIDIPVFDSGSRPGKTLLVTAGIDGDEYAGIEAACELIKRYKKKIFHGRLIVIPVVNVMGFAAKTSYNPQDLLYPKYTYPGNPKGKPTEQLMAWLVETYVARADGWIDLHGGSLKESLIPFLWAFETKRPDFDQMSTDIIETTGKMAVFQKNHGWGKIRDLAKKNCFYLLNESGCKGSHTQKDKAAHHAVVDRCLSLFELIQEKDNHKRVSPVVFSAVHEHKTSSAGLWKNTVVAGASVSKGDIVGYLEKNGKNTPYRSVVSGVVLWMVEETHLERPDVVFGVGCQ